MKMIKLEFPGRGGAKQKTLRGGSMNIFWNCTLWIIVITTNNKSFLFLSGAAFQAPFTLNLPETSSKVSDKRPKPTRQ